MNYIPTNWKNGDVITKERLNNIENGIVGAQLPDITYIPTEWKNGDIITADKLNKIENGIATAGGGGDDPSGANVGDVMFIDYDGTVVRAYSKDDFLALSAMPENPSHEGLVAQGWNWSLADAKAYLTDYPKAKLNIGQMYATESGATEIDIELGARLSPVLTICVNGTVTVDWGDDTTPDTVTGSSLETRLGVPHTYSAAGAYTIKIAPVSDESDAYAFYGDDVDHSYAYALLRKNGEEIPLDENLVYANAIRAIRLGSASEILSSAFIGCYALASIMIPDGITSIGDYAFNYCYSLSSVTIPDSVTSIGDYVFDGCYSLSNITIPDGVTSIGDYAFGDCYSLTSIAIPSGVTSIGDGAFNYCYSLSSVTIPEGVTSIGGGAFSGCYSLSSVTIPSSVTSIGDSAFQCYGVAKYHILPTEPPTIGEYTFQIVSDMVIYVPVGSLEAYQTAEYWSALTDYLREKPSA